MKIKIKKLIPGAVVPVKATPGAAAYDVFIPSAVTISPGRQIVSLGLSIEIPEGYEAKIEPRSGFSANGMEDIYKCRRDADVIPGKIDSDYRGPIGVIVNNHEPVCFRLSEGERIAQLTIYKVETADFQICEELSETERGGGGFGHSGAGREISRVTE